MTMLFTDAFNNLPPFSVAVGAPARVIRKRGEPLEKMQGDK
jgi:acetyltransferase-like isoleucine patch superfamily enzyme